ncbi:hypothetical protein C5C35_14480 [Rathayibacter sp. AY1F8]|nr:hypothetical protein C5C52_03195 [Rathayibacter sp. AY1E5]PPH14635.1 hypothetical protein C5C35_14480 [Rathayibacter sp. AY1F8]
MRVVAVITVGIVLMMAVTAVSIAALDFGRNRGWWGVSDSLHMLQHEPLASQKLLGLALATSTSEQRFDSLLTSAAVVSNCFTTDPESAEALDQAIAIAVADGWTEAADTRQTSTWAGRKPAPSGGEMTAILTFGDHLGSCASNELGVRLVY